MSRYGLWRTLYIITCRRNARTNVKRVVVLPPHETLDVKLTGLRVEGWAVDLNAAHASEKRRAGAILDHRGTALATSSVKDTKAMSIHVAQTSPCGSIVNSEEWNMISNFKKEVENCTSPFGALLLHSSRIASMISFGCLSIVYENSPAARNDIVLRTTSSCLRQQWWRRRGRGQIPNTVPLVTVQRASSPAV